MDLLQRDRWHDCDVIFEVLYNKCPPFKWVVDVVGAGIDWFYNLFLKDFCDWADKVLKGIAVDRSYEKCTLY